jgi:5-formyltetrahydrofolate cyclo-ligase
MDLKSIKVVHSFLPILSKKEPNTSLIIDRLKKDFPQIRISIPRVENNDLLNFYFEDESQLKKNQWGILEPASGEPTPTEIIDLVIVPLLAFDRKGNRVGYGKGFYDRFLNDCRTDCKKVGLSFFEPTSSILLKEAHDIPMDVVITPTHVFTF